MGPRNCCRRLPLLLAVVTAISASFGPAPCRELRADDKAPEPASQGVRSPGADISAVPDAPLDKPKQRQREGVKLSDRRGRFERRGERYVFLSEAPIGHYLVLENLMLERVANVLADAAGGQLRWSVSGTVTEYRGANYLMLDRAVVKASQEDVESPRPSDPHLKTTFRSLPAPSAQR